MEKKYVMAIDGGTTSSRVIFFDRNAKPVSVAAKPVTNLFPDPETFIQDPMDCWQAFLECMEKAMAQANITFDEIATIGITTHRESLVCWNKNTGQPYFDMMIWGDHRSVEQTNIWNGQPGLISKVRQITGMPIDPSYTASKIAWMLKHVDGFKDEVMKGNVCAGNPDAWTIWKLSGGKAHVTDSSMASRTMMLDITKDAWSEELLKELGIPSELILPKVMPSVGIMGYTDPKITGGVEIPISGCFGDQQAGTFGQTIFEPMTGKTSYGTAAVTDFNIGNSVQPSDAHKVATSIGWKIGDDITYIVDACIFSAGSMIQWLRDNLGFFSSSQESGDLASSVPDSKGVFVVPAMSGISSPHFDPYARTTIVGVTGGVHKEHIIRATMEGICYSVRDNVIATEEAINKKIVSMNCDGGAAASDFLMQIQADILGVPVMRPTDLEMTALGAAYGSGLGVGFWKSLDEIKSFWKLDRVFEPQISADQREGQYEQWLRAVERSRNWAK